MPTTSDGGTSLVDRMMDVSGENQGASRDEIELELRAARLFLSRRQLPEARASLKRILAAEPDNRDAAELLGRALLDAGDSAGAQAALKSALEIHPGDERLEEVYARAVLAVSEAERARAEAYADAARKRTHQRGGPAFPPLASVVICGLGQFLNGEVAKGLVMAAVAYISLVLGIALGGKALMNGFWSLIVGQGVVSGGGRASGFALFLTAVYAITCIVSIVDAALVARGSARSGRQRTGWDV